MVKQTHLVAADVSGDVKFKGAGASKLVVGFFSVLGLFALIGAPGAGKFVGFMVLVIVLSTYFLSGAYRVILLPDRMRYGMFGLGSVVYGDIKQIRDINSWSVAYLKLILTRHDGGKIKLWHGLSYNAQILSELRGRAHFEYVDG